MINDRYEDGVGDVSGTGGTGHKRSVSWSSRVLFNDPTTIDDIPEALEDQDIRVNG